MLMFSVQVAFAEIPNSCIYTETTFSCKTIKSAEQFGRQYKHVDAPLDE